MKLIYKNGTGFVKEKKKSKFNLGNEFYIVESFGKTEDYPFRQR